MPAESDVIQFEKMIMHLSWAIQKQLAQELIEFHLTVPQYVALRAIQHEENGCTMTRLAQASYQVAATMTGIIDRLVDQGLVERVRDASDRRTQRVILTAAGKNLLSQVEIRNLARLNGFLQEMTPTDIEQMLGWMQRYLEVMVEEQVE